MSELRLTGEVVPARISADCVVAAGVGHEVTYQRSGWTVGDLRAMLSTLPAEFDSNPIVVHAPGGRSTAAMRTASMTTDGATSALALHTTTS